MTGKHSEAFYNSEPVYTVNDIPNHIYETLARGLLPELERFYATEENRKARELWKESQNKNKEENNDTL